MLFDKIGKIGKMSKSSKTGHDLTHCIRVTAERSEEYDTELAKWCVEKGLKALIVYEQASRGHYQGFVLTTRTSMSVRSELKSIFAIQSGEKDRYSVAAMRKTMDELLRYTCKGESETSLPDVVVNTEGYLTDEFHSAYWVQNAAMRDAAGRNAASGPLLERMRRHILEVDRVPMDNWNTMNLCLESAARLLQKEAKYSDKIIDANWYYKAAMTVFYGDSEMSVAEISSQWKARAARG